MALLDTIAGEGYAGEGFGFEPAAATVEGAVYLVTPNGDKDFGRVLGDIEVGNPAAFDIWVGKTLSEAVTAGSERVRVLAGKSTFLAGPYATMVVYNPAGSGGSCLWRINALKTARLNPGVRGGHAGHGEIMARVVAVANGVATVRVTTWRACTITGARAWSDVKEASAAGSVLLAIKNALNEDILSSGSYDLEGMTNNVLATLPLTATTSRLSLAAGATLDIKVTSNNIDLVVGDLAIAILYEL